jgi:hypothetical protein
MQWLLATAGWDPGLVRDDLRSYVVEDLGDTDGVLVVDETWRAGPALGWRAPARAAWRARASCG